MAGGALLTLRGLRSGVQGLLRVGQLVGVMRGSSELLIRRSKVTEVDV